jgi:hypothetical protein
VLDAMVRPEGLRAVGGLDLLVRLVVLVRGGEGDVLRGVPVLGEENVVEAVGEDVDEREDFVATGDGEGSSGHEVGLEIDEEECGGGLVDGHGGLGARRSKNDGYVLRGVQDGDDGENSLCIIHRIEDQVPVESVDGDTTQIVKLGTEEAAGGTPMRHGTEGLHGAEYGLIPTLGQLRSAISHKVIGAADDFINCGFQEKEFK